ncbi:MAG: hypothetical protein ACT4OO_10380 [Nitrospiraceae bacterium]
MPSYTDLCVQDTTLHSIVLICAKWVEYTARQALRRGDQTSMLKSDRQEDEARQVENLCRAVELTDLCLALRCAALGPQDSPHEAMKRVMREVLEAKERAWRPSPS